MDKTIAIVQSSYLPWKGYFDLIRSADVFVLYDDVQYTKRDWRSRNVIKTAQGPLWLTVPVRVKGRYHQLIREVEIADTAWAEHHWRSIELAYRKAPGFAAMGPTLKALLEHCAGMNHLSSVNRYLTEQISTLLGIKTPILDSHEFGRVDGKSENLLNLCLSLGGTIYLSGPAARSYLDESVFEKAGVQVRYMDYDGYPEYPQLHPPFDHHVSIVDLLLCTGHEARRYLERTPALVS
jgi:hypothetical protein